MTDEQILEVWEAAKTRVFVSCDEAHAHSARQGCLSPKTAGGPPVPLNNVRGLVGSTPGDARDVTICILAEILFDERKLVRDVAEKFGMVFMKIGKT